MTDPKLRDARIAEAVRRWHLDRDGSGEDLARITTDLIEQDWRPEPEVDAVEAAFIKWRDQVGGFDALDAFRAGHAHARQALEATDDQPR